jgi:signal transduction histidine kinase
MHKHGYTFLFKVITIVLFLSATLWAVLEPLQNYRLKQLFHAQLQRNLQHYAQEDRNNLDSQFKKLRDTLQLLVGQTSVQQYIETKPWENSNTAVKNWQQHPPWLPNTLQIRAIFHNADLILLDHNGQLQEIYHQGKTHSADPKKIQFFQKESSILQQLSHDQFHLTAIKSRPFLVVSADIHLKNFGEIHATEDPHGHAAIMMLIPLDSDFLFKTKNVIDPNRVMVLIEASSNIILASSFDDVEEGESLDSLKNDYLMLGKQFFDYGNSELEVGLVSLVSTQSIEKLSGTVLNNSRIQRAIIAFSLVILFVILSYFFIRRVRILSRQLRIFASEDFGVELNDPNRDEIVQLMSLFQQLMNEIRTGRDKLHAEVKEKQRYLEKMVAAQKQLVQAQKLEAVGQLAAGIAHEINTPTQYVTDNTHFLGTSFNDLMHLIEKFRLLLQAVKENHQSVPIELLAEIDTTIKEIDLDFMLSEMPQAIKENISGLKRISIIVKAMKEFSNPGSSEYELLSINDIINNTVTISSSEWNYVADIKTELAEDIPQIYGNSGKLGQVFLNIIINSAHAIGEIGCQFKAKPKSRGLIHIASRLVEKCVEIRISDNGPGIPEEIMKRVFDPFFTTKQVDKGDGQGLSIAYAVIVEQLQGTLRIESAPSEGATFIITIPLSTANTSDAKDISA